MNRLTVSLIVTGLALILLFLLGRWLLLGDLESRIAEETLRQEQATAELARLTAEHDALKASLASAPARLPLRWLGIGEEATLLRGLFDAASGTQIIMRKFEFLPIFHLKGDTSEQSGRPAPTAPPEILPQFDERTGQAVGAETDEGDTEWPGVEILPVRVEMKGLFAGIVGFFLHARRSLPRFHVRSLDLGIEESGIVKGNAILVFPVLAKTAPPAPTPSAAPAPSPVPGASPPTAPALSTEGGETDEAPSHGD